MEDYFVTTDMHVYFTTGTAKFCRRKSMATLDAKVNISHVRVINIK